MGAVGKRRRRSAAADDDAAPRPAAAVRRLRATAGPRIESLLREIGGIAAEQGVRGALVGGAVRDTLLGRRWDEPDVVVAGKALPLARELAARHGGTLTTHRAFGTAVVHFPDGTHVDVAGARRETYAHPAALPSVRPSTFDDDALRRDFAVNALRLELAPGRFGRIHDPLGGLADLAAGRLRALHPASFDDDPTRAYRAVRFAARLDFRIDRTTAGWIDGALERGVFARLSAQRLRREIELVFDDEQPVRAAVLLDRHGLWRPLHAALSSPRAVVLGIGEALGRLGSWPAEEPPPERWLAALSVAAAPLDPAGLSELVERLGPDRRGRTVLAAAGSGLRRLAARLARMARPSRVAALLDGLALETLAAAGSLSRGAGGRVDAYVASWRGVRADVDGRALLAAGVPAGPGLARGISAARAVKLDREAAPAEQMRIALAAARRRESGRA